MKSAFQWPVEHTSWDARRKIPGFNLCPDGTRGGKIALQLWSVDRYGHQATWLGVCSTCLSKTAERKSD